MTHERTQYRSSIDELVCKSGISGTKIAAEMGVPLNRIVALRRANSKNISSDDLAACSAAIIRLGGDVAFNQDGDLDFLPHGVCPCRFLESLNEAVKEQSARLDTLIKKIDGGKDG